MSNDSKSESPVQNFAGWNSNISKSNSAPGCHDHEQQEGLVFSPREVEVLKLIGQGSTNNEIAEALCISPNTVKNHITSIFSIFGNRNRTIVALWARTHLLTK